MPSPVARGLDWTHTVPAAPLPPALSSPVLKHPTQDWECSRRTGRDPSVYTQGSGKGKRVSRKVREGADTGSRKWVVGERVLFGECMGMFGLGGVGSRGAGVLSVCRWQLSRELMKCRGLKMKQCRSRHGTCK